MIRIEHVVFPSPEQMAFIIEGMRNPMNSWDNSDSEMHLSQLVWRDEKIPDKFIIGSNDITLMHKLSAAGTDHRKFMRMMPVYIRITAPLYWWKEFDTYKVGTVANSCSTMHKIQEKEFTLDDFSCEHLTPQSLELLKELINLLNIHRMVYNCKNDNRVDSFRVMSDECYANYKKDIWWQLIQLLPSSYNQTRNVMLNYEVLANIYNSRRNHKLDEWGNFCDFIEHSVPYNSLIYVTPLKNKEETND